MMLRELVAQYLAQHEYGVSASYGDQMRYSISAWEKFAARRLVVEDLNDSEVNRYLDWMREHRKHETVRSRRGNILTLWHWAHVREITSIAPRHVRRLRRIARAPEAWSLDEIQRLFAAADDLPGRFQGRQLRRSAWWSALLRAAYDTDLRLGDLLRLRASTLRPVMNLVQHKTGRVVTVQLRPATLAAIDQTLADEPRDIIWMLWATRRTFCKHVRRLVSDAGIRPGTFRWLRRTAITQLERVAPGQGTRLAGHAHRSTTETWYIDRSQLDPAPLPPLEMPR